MLIQRKPLQTKYADTKLKVFDFFSGCGGTSKGFESAGMEVVFALDNDPDAKSTFVANFPKAQFHLGDITELKPADIESVVCSCKDSPLLFCGCAPCQPFTKQNTRRRRTDERRPLLEDFQRFVQHYQPEFVFVENVPGIQKVGRGSTRFKSFVSRLKALGYFVDYDVVSAQDYGVPQKRRRLVLVASRLFEIDIPPYTHGPGTANESYSTVRQWIQDLPRIAHGETHPEVLNHRAARLSEKNLERIQNTPEGGGRRDWPPELWLKCHSSNYTGHTDVYGRIRWDEPATGITTRCTSLSNGRFGHPTQDRAISVREAACLQTFPRDFVFKGNLSSMSRQVGNAVPVRLAEVFGQHFIEHLNAYLSGAKPDGDI